MNQYEQITFAYKLKTNINDARLYYNATVSKYPDSYNIPFPIATLSLGFLGYSYFLLLCIPIFLYYLSTEA